VECNGSAVQQDELQQMVRSLLEDRFKFKAHHEMREMPLYDLLVTKDGSKMKASEDQTPTVLSAARVQSLCATPPSEIPGNAAIYR
jgi:uncharacterized protein (TIGR03435 family)